MNIRSFYGTTGVANALNTWRGSSVDARREGVLASDAAKEGRSQAYRRSFHPIRIRLRPSGVIRSIPRFRAASVSRSACEPPGSCAKDRSLGLRSSFRQPVLPPYRGVHRTCSHCRINSGGSTLHTFSRSSSRRPSGVREKSIRRLSSSPIFRYTSPFCSTERITFEAFEQLSCKLSAISPDVSVSWRHSRQSRTPSLSERPYRCSNCCSKSATARARSRIRQRVSIGPDYLRRYSSIACLNACLGIAPCSICGRPPFGIKRMDGMLRMPNAAARSGSRSVLTL